MVRNTDHASGFRVKVAFASDTNPDLRDLLFSHALLGRAALGSAVKGTAMNAIHPSALAPLSASVIPPHPADLGSRWLAGFDRRDFLEVGAYDFAPATVRAVMRERLPLWGLGHLLEAAELVGSELTANAVTATRESAWDGSVPPVRVWLLGGAATAGVVVGDAVLRAPVRQAVGQDDESGRGLQIVDALSSEWGSYFPPHPFAGKVTWAFVRQSDFTEG
jgi:hypothetical protein